MYFLVIKIQVCMKCNMGNNHQDTVRQMALEAGVLRARDARSAGIPSMVLTRMVARGNLVRVGRGLYELPHADIGEHHTLAEAAKRMPGGVICLLSALSFHGLTTQQPFEVWMAHRRGSWASKSDAPPLRLFRFSAASFEYGVEQHVVDGVLIQVTSAAKTVADCFKFRSTVGLDVALEAARDYLRLRSGTVDELWQAARVCRVHNVMRPYLEALL